MNLFDLIMFSSILIGSFGSVWFNFMWFGLVPLIWRFVCLVSHDGVHNLYGGLMLTICWFDFIWFCSVQLHLVLFEVVWFGSIWFGSIW
jgi:hypothetical protein